MIELMPNLPAAVLGFSAHGQVTAADYENVLIPAVEAALKERSKLRLIYHLGEGFTGFDAGAMWDDAKVGLQHPSAWERVALVSDVEWIRVVAKTFGFALPGHVRVFHNAEIADAVAWISE